ncbi:MAG: tetratricopeptide repeat protein [Gammaproteobacteria bacterium]
MKAWNIAALAVALILQSQVTVAATLFWPTPSEWANWPEYCRAKYAYLRRSETLEFGPPVPSALFEKYDASLGRAWVFIHHHCAGLGYLQRAQLARTPGDKKEALRKAFSESRFTFVRIPEEIPVYAEIATHMGTVSRASGDAAAALNYYGLAIQTHPDFPGGYQGTALVLQDQGKMDAAVKILLEGDEATGGSSAEIHYFLGMAYLKQKDFDKAVEHAERAYELGYPLPGLRNKLAAAGHPIT